MDSRFSIIPIALYYDSIIEDANSQRCLQSRSFTDPAGTVQLSSAFESQQLMSLLLPEENFGSNPLPPPPSAQHWAYGHHSPINYYSHVMDSSTSPDSLTQPSPVDYNSYSPQSSSSSSSSSCYNSPSRIDSGYGLATEQFHYQHCSLQHCYCLSPWVAGLHDSLPAPECSSYGPTDCAYASSVHDSYFRRDLTSAEMCYL